MEEKGPASPAPFSGAEVAALSHLYRGEMYRSKMWRNRLDTTTNWAVGTTGLAVSASFSAAQNSPLPILLVSLLVTVFWAIEARRYRYFDIWRTRVRLLEVFFFGPILRRQPVRLENSWNHLLAEDYESLGFHISFWEAAGRRLRRNYIWIFLVLASSYLAKIAVHPVPVQTWSQFLAHAAIGLLSGKAVLLSLAVCFVALLAFAAVTLRRQQAAGRITDLDDHNEPVRKLGLRI